MHPNYVPLPIWEIVGWFFFGGGGRLEFPCWVERHVVFSLFFLSRPPRSIKSSFFPNLLILRLLKLRGWFSWGKIKALLLLSNPFIREIGGGFCWTFPTEVAEANYCIFLTLRSNSISEIRCTRNQLFNSPKRRHSLPRSEKSPRPFRGNRQRVCIKTVAN